MGLPWFEFNIKDFVTNTLRLNTEAKGAYLMLMLDYYEHGEGPPADAEVLATITGLSLETWHKHARVILPLFEVRAGRLYHERIVETISRGLLRYAGSMRGIAAAKVSREAKAAERAARTGTKPPPERPKTPEGTLEVAPEEPLAAPPMAPYKQEHSSIEEMVSYDTIARAGESEVKEALQQTLVPSDFTPSPVKIIGYQNEGYSSAEIGHLIDRFKRWYVAEGTMSDDWQRTWDKYWARKKVDALPLPTTKPRIEVTRKIAKPIPPDWTPNAGHFEIANELGLNCRVVEDTFRDYCDSSGKKYIDHDAAFRNFLRNQPSFNRGHPNGKTHGPDRSIVNAAIRRDADLDRQIEALEGGQPDGGDAVLSLPEVGLRPPGSGVADDGDDS